MSNSLIMWMMEIGSTKLVTVWIVATTAIIAMGQKRTHTSVQVVFMKTTISQCSAKPELFSKTVKGQSVWTNQYVSTKSRSLKNPWKMKNAHVNIQAKEPGKSGKTMECSMTRMFSAPLPPRS